MFLVFMDATMARYELKLSGQSSRQAELHSIPQHARTTQNDLHVYIRETLKPNQTIPRKLMSLNDKLLQSDVYDRTDVTDFVSDMPVRR